LDGGPAAGLAVRVAPELAVCVRPGACPHGG